MAIDAGIALGLKPVQIENPLNNMVKFANIQNDMANMALHKQKMAEDARLQGLNVQFGLDLANLGDSASPEYENKLRQAFINKGDPKGYQEHKTAVLANKNTEADIQKKRQETRSQAYHNIVYNPSPENIIAHNQDFQLNPDNSPEDKASSKRTADMLVAMPLDQRVAWLASQGASAADLKPSQHVVGAGDRSVVVSTPAYGGQSTEVGSVQMGATPKEKLEYTPKYLAEVAERDRTANDIKKTEALYDNSSGTPMREVFKSQLQDYYTRLDEQDKRIAGMKSEEAALKQNPDAKLAIINDVAKLRRAGVSETDPHLKNLVLQMEYNRTHPEGSNTYFTTDQTGTVHAIDKKTLKERAALPGAGKPQQNLVQFGPDGQPIQNKALPQHAIEVQAKNRASIGNIVSTLQDVATNPSAFGYQNMLPEAITQHLDPAGVTARANVANIGSLKLHDRSGANVTVGEVPRLRPFIHNITYDDAPTIAKKLQGLQREIVIYQAEQDKAFAAQGYNIGSTAGATPPAEPTLHKHPKTKGRDTTNPLL